MKFKFHAEVSPPTSKYSVIYGLKTAVIEYKKRNKTTFPRENAPVFPRKKTFSGMPVTKKSRVFHVISATQKCITKKRSLLFPLPI